MNLYLLLVLSSKNVTVCKVLILGTGTADSKKLNEQQLLYIII